MVSSARIFLRQNGKFGAAYDGCADTGHHIVEDSGLFTVWSIHDEDEVICKLATRSVAQEAIAEDWHRF